MFRRSNSGELFFLVRETNSKENAMNMELAAIFKVVKLGKLHIVDL